MFELLDKLGARPIDVATELADLVPRLQPPRRRPSPRPQRSRRRPDGALTRPAPQLARIMERRARPTAAAVHRLAVDGTGSSTQSTTRSPGVARLSIARTAASSSRIFSALTARASPVAAGVRTPATTFVADSPGLRPRRFLSSRTMISSNASAAIAPYSRWSSSRRSPGMPMTPSARPRRRARPPTARSGRPRQRRRHHPLDEVGQLAHPVDVVAVVDDDPDAVHVDHVEPARRLEERRRERAQALADVVDVRARRPRRRGGGQGVGDVHPGAAAERRRDEVRVQHRHRPRPEAQHHELAFRRVWRQNAAPPRRRGRRPGRTPPRPSRSPSRRARRARRSGGPSGRRADRRR